MGSRLYKTFPSWVSGSLKSFAFAMLLLLTMDVPGCSQRYTYLYQHASGWLPFRIRQLQLGILQVLLDGPLQLPKGKYSLHYSACPHRMTAGQQATGWVHRHGRLLWKVHAVINAGNTGLATCRVGPAFTVFAETHVLVGLDL